VTAKGAEQQPIDRSGWESLSPIQKAIRFLADTQVTEEGPGLPYWIGGWPKQIDIFFKNEKKATLPEVTTQASLVIHALGAIDDRSASVLGLSSDDMVLVSRMRRKAVQYLRRLEISGHGILDGSYGYWPLRPRNDSFFLKLKNTILRIRLRLRVYNGILHPLHMPKIPVPYQVWPDADDTAWVYMAYLDAAANENISVPELPAERLFGTWRDTGSIPVIFPKWRHKPTGGFLTWFAGTPERKIVNDVDLCVNANVVAALGRYGRLDLPGVEEAIRLITKAIEAGLHKCSKNISLYYPDDLSTHYFVTHAYRYGGVAEFGPVAEQLADEIEEQAIVGPDGLAHWKGEFPYYSTSLALLSLAYCGRSGPLFDQACQWLERRQNPKNGSWPKAMFCWTFDKDLGFYWKSQAIPTAMALAALCRCRLEQEGLSVYPHNSD